MNLEIILWGIILFGTLATYIMLDGFDLGVGTLYGLCKNENDKKAMLNAILPYWDGNETWLIAFVTALWGGLPIAFSVIVPSIYSGVFILLAVLIFRVAAFEFSHRGRPSDVYWQKAMAIASLLIPFALGTVFGYLLHGISVGGEFPFYKFTGHTFDWINPFSVCCGITAVTLTLALGSSWAHGKVENSVIDMITKISLITTPLAGLFLIIMGFWQYVHAVNNFDLTHINLRLTIAIVTSVMIVLSVIAHHFCIKKTGLNPFIALVILVVSSLIFAFSTIFPYVVAPAIDFAHATVQQSDFTMVLILNIIILPILAFYSRFAFKVFAGKVKHDTFGH